MSNVTRISNVAHRIVVLAFVGCCTMAASSPAIDGRAYRELGSDHGTSFEVPPATPHADRLNRWALEWLRKQAVVALECNSAKGGAGEPLGSWLKPILWTQAFLVLEDGLPDTYCGGAHGNASLLRHTWSLPQGRLVNTWTWLRGGNKALVAHANRNGETIRSGLFRLIVREHPRNQPGDDCGDVMDAMHVDAPHPTAEGLVFGTTFFHAMRACNEDVRLSWKQVGPYLSQDGRAAMAVAGSP